MPIGQFAFIVRESDAQSGVIVTGSHMSHDRIGLIVFQEDGTYAPFDVTDHIESIMSNIDSVTPAAIDTLGSSLEYEDAYEKYVAFLHSASDVSRISRRKFRILVDPANGPASGLAREIFERLKCNVSVINQDYRPVPRRPSEPLPENIVEAANIVKVMGFDIGVCFDVDADRSVFIDERGCIVSTDVIGAVFALHVLQEGDVCVTPANSSGLIAELARRTGFKIQFCKIGQPETIKAIKKYKALFAYEETGKYYFAGDCLWSDGILSTLKLLEIMSVENKTLSELTSKIPAYHTLKMSVKIDSRAKLTALKRIRTHIQTLFNEERYEVLDFDGLKYLFEDGSSIMFRLSGTEPLLRLYCDAATEKRVKYLFTTGKKLLQQLQ